LWRLDELNLECPFFGSRRMAAMLQVNRKRVQRLMRILGIEALYPKHNLSRPAPGHEVYPYLLRGVSIERPNHVWSNDITYLPMQGGFLYLVAVMDWFSRFVLSWELSNTLETGFCLAALEAAFRFGQPEIWNSDQGAQFTAADFLAPLKKRGITLSMDGRGRAGHRPICFRTLARGKGRHYDGGRCPPNPLGFTAVPTRMYLFSLSLWARLLYTERA